MTPGRQDLAESRASMRGSATDQQRPVTERRVPRIASRIARNSLSNYVGSVVGLVVGFVLTPFLVHSLGNTGYGAWVVVGSVTGYFWLMDFGIGASVQKFVADLSARTDHNKLNAVLTSSCVLMLLSGLACLAISWIVAPYAGAAFGMSEPTSSTVQTMLYLTGVTLAISLPLGLFGGVLRGYQRSELVNLIAVISTLANALLSFAVLSLGLGLIGLTLVALVTTVAVGVARLIFTLRIYPTTRVHPSLFSTAVLREIAHFSVWVLVINVAAQVVYRTGPLVISTLLGVASVTPFALATSLIQYVRRLVDPVLAVLLPAYAEIAATNDSGRIRRLFTESSKIVGALAMPPLLALCLLGRPFFIIWLGAEYEESIYVVYVLAPPVLLGLLISTGDKVLWARGKVRVNSWVAVADMGLNLGLSMILVRSSGIIGAAWATCISVLLTNGLFLLPVVCHEAGIGVREYGRTIGRFVLAPAIPAALAVLLLTEHVGTASYAQLLILASVCALTYWCSVATVAGSHDRRVWFALARSIVNVPKLGTTG